MRLWAHTSSFNRTRRKFQKTLNTKEQTNTMKEETKGKRQVTVWLPESRAGARGYRERIASSWEARLPNRTPV